MPHHGLDLLDVEEECTVQWFQTVARTAIADVQARGSVPLLVGGSGLYFRAVVDDLEFPPTDPSVRRRLEERYAGDPAAGHAELQRTDPDAARRMEPTNLRRIVRALEVRELTGRPFSEWREALDAHESRYAGAPGRRRRRADRRAWPRTDARVDAMLAQGWLEECRGLHQRRLSTTARQAIGYAELFAHLDGDLVLTDATAAIKTRTRRFAARQRRWFGKDPRVQWTDPQRALTAVRAALTGQAKPHR